ncbi:tol-pal system YbgF family protein [Bacteroidota bacterium]
MKLRLIVLLILLLVTASLDAQSSKKGFRKIEKGEFLEAEDIFNKVLSDSPDDAVTQFGLALLYSDSLFPKNDYFTAYRYLNWAKDNYMKIDSSEIKKIEDVITLEKIEQHALYIDEIVYQQIVATKDLSMVKIYLSDFANNRHFNDVILIRNEMEFEKAKAVNTLEVYNDFIIKFPDANEIKEAITLRNQLAFIKAKEKNSFESINKFINNYPDAEEVPQAIAIIHRLAFNAALQENTIEALENYIAKYPSSSLIDNAIAQRNEKEFQITLNSNSIIAFNEFIQKYPDAEQVEIAKHKIEELLPWTCFPGIKAGMIEYNTTELDLVSHYGSESVKLDTLQLANDNIVIGISLFPNEAQKKIFITWKDQVNKVNPASIYVFGDKWQTNRGIKTGMSLEKLIEINGRDFTIAGFSQQGEGNVISWEEGELSVIHKINVTFRLKFAYDKSNFYKISEEGLLELTQSPEISTDNNNLNDLQLKVEQFEIIFP